MQWQLDRPENGLTPQVELDLCRMAVELKPRHVPAQLRYAQALFRQDLFEDARIAFEAALALDPTGFTEWVRLARCCVARKLHDRALEVCALAEGRASPAELDLLMGEALAALDRQEEAAQAFDRVVAAGDPTREAIYHRIARLAKQADGGPLLAFCDALGDNLRRTSPALVGRAIALSRLGREDEAGGLIDLERHVVRYRLDPPDGFASSDEFHRQLVAEVARGAEDGADESIEYDPPLGDRPALAALLDSLRWELGRYMQDAARRDLAQFLPPPPEAPWLYVGLTTLRRGGSNGEHIHKLGILSCVYHVAVPEEVARAEDDRGALLLGSCRQFTGGYRPCWGERSIRPEPGWLTIFPSHVFHDVVPPHTDAPRITVAADLQAVKPSPA